MTSGNSKPENGSSDTEDMTEFTPASRTLQKKAGGPKGQFGKFKLEAAEAKIAERSDAFLAQMDGEISALRAAYSEIAQQDTADEKAASDIAMRAREVKGLAGTFGFDLLTQIGDSLYEFATELTALDAKQIELMGAHIDAMELVIQNKITGDGGDVARELLNTLGIATDKLS